MGFFLRLILAENTASMSISRGIYSWFFKNRQEQVNYFIRNPFKVQKEQFDALLESGKRTKYGQDYGFDSINSLDDFAAQVPITFYEQLKPYIQRVLEGESDVIWPGVIKWFAKSSGTTQDRSKFIPISTENLENCHFQGGKDVFGIYLNKHDSSKILDGRSLVLGGSNTINQLNENSYYGDLSAVILQNLPIWAELLRTPDLKTALNPNYEEKIEQIARKTIEKNVTNVVGVPTWTVVLFNRILEITGKDHINEVWPNLELYVHGGVSFEPYKDLFKNYIPSESMTYLETYNASEGFFALQDDVTQPGMLLMLDYGIYYEFIPMDEFDEEKPRTIGLEDVELDKNYALVITTNSGLWRYKVGDTIKFTSLNPFRVKVTGRTKHFINAFGEELIIENAETAVSRASVLHDCAVRDFTAAPIYFSEGGGKGAHEWLVEFEKAPENHNAFVETLDRELRLVNSDYDAKRKNNMALGFPKVQQVPKNTFYDWLKSIGKLGGQHKVPRLKNDRSVLESIKSFID